MRKMKKIFVLSVVSLLLINSVATFGQHFGIAESNIWEEADVEVTINKDIMVISGVGELKKVRTNPLISKLIIKEGITKIGDFVFADGNLKSVELPSSLEEIGIYAFQNNKLENVKLPNSVNRIGDRAFSNNKLVSVNIPSSLTLLEERTFEINQIKEVLIPSNIKKTEGTIRSIFLDNENIIINKEGKIEELPIDNFDYEDKIKREYTPNVKSTYYKGDEFIYTVPENGEALDFKVTEIYDIKDNGDKVITLPKTLNGKKVGGSIILEGKDIEHINIPNDYDAEIVSLANNNLKEITIPKSNKKFPNLRNNQLTKVIINNNPKVIPVNALEGNNLRTIELPESVEAIARYAFAFNRLENIKLPNNLSQIGEGAFLNNQLTSVEIPKGVELIRANTFSRNNLTSIIIPDTVKEIDDGAFSNNQIKDLKLSNQLTEIRRGVFSNNKIKTVEIPKNVEKILSNAFSNNAIENIIFSQNLKHIAEKAFKDNYIRTLNFPDALEDIDEKAFYNNPLEEINLGNSIEFVREKAFDRDGYIIKLLSAPPNKVTEDVDWDLKINCPSHFTKFDHFMIIKNNEIKGHKLEYIAESGERYVYNKYSSYVEVIDITNTKNKLIIIDEIEGQPVMEINSFNLNLKNVEEVVIPKSVERIGGILNSAKENTLKSVTIESKTLTLFNETFYQIKDFKLNGEGIVYGYKDSKIAVYASEHNLNFSPIDGDTEINFASNNEVFMDFERSQEIEDYLNQYYVPTEELQSLGITNMTKLITKLIEIEHITDNNGSQLPLVTRKNNHYIFNIYKEIGYEDNNIGVTETNSYNGKNFIKADMSPEKVEELNQRPMINKDNGVEYSPSQVRELLLQKAKLDNKRKALLNDLTGSISSNYDPNMISENINEILGRFVYDQKLDETLKLTDLYFLGAPKATFDKEILYMNLVNLERDANGFFKTYIAPYVTTDYYEWVSNEYPNYNLERHSNNMSTSRALGSLITGKSLIGLQYELKAIEYEVTGQVDEAYLVWHPDFNQDNISDFTQNLDAEEYEDRYYIGSYSYLGTYTEHKNSGIDVSPYISEIVPFGINGNRWESYVSHNLMENIARPVDKYFDGRGELQDGKNPWEELGFYDNSGAFYAPEIVESLEQSFYLSHRDSYDIMNDSSLVIDDLKHGKNFFVGWNTCSSIEYYDGLVLEENGYDASANIGVMLSNYGMDNSLIDGERPKYNIEEDLQYTKIAFLDTEMEVVIEDGSKDPNGPEPDEINDDTKKNPFPIPDFPEIPDPMKPVIPAIPATGGLLFFFWYKKRLKVYIVDQKLTEEFYDSIPTNGDKLIEIEIVGKVKFKLGKEGHILIRQEDLEKLLVREDVLEGLVKIPENLAIENVKVKLISKDETIEKTSTLDKTNFMTIEVRK